MAINGTYNAHGWAKFYTATEDGTYSADAGDYWDARNDTNIGMLVRENHEYVTVTGKRVHGPRVLKQNATIGDLRRLQRARDSIQRRK